MFVDQNKYPVFYEIYKNQRKFPHMQLECIPLPKVIGESAPMYFKVNICINGRMISYKYIALNSICNVPDTESLIRV